MIVICEVVTLHNFTEVYYNYTFPVQFWVVYDYPQIHFTL